MKAPSTVRTSRASGDRKSADHWAGEVISSSHIGMVVV